MATIILVGLTALIAGPCEDLSAYLAKRRNIPRPKVYRKPDRHKKSSPAFHNREL